MSALGPPVDLGRPFFAYGLLKPGELAFSVLEPFVTSLDRAWARGTLWLRDRIPLFGPGADGQMAGWLLWFDPARSGEAWEAVCSFEPPKQYKWAVVQAHSGAEGTDANVLAGRRVRAGSAGENVQEWSAERDPVFTEGLAEVERLTGEAAPDGNVHPPARHPGTLEQLLPAPSRLPVAVEHRRAVHGVAVRSRSRPGGPRQTVG